MWLPACTKLEKAQSFVSGSSESPSCYGLSMAANLYKVLGSGQTPSSLAVVVEERLVVMASDTYTLEVVVGTWGLEALTSDSEAVVAE